MSKKQIVLKDIANKLNVSTVTVSKALRDHPDISSETTRLVKKTASELGYSSNFMARNLSARRSNTIGVVIPKIAHNFFSSIVEHIYSYAFDTNYEIILTVSQENSLRERKHIQTLVSNRVDGIIVSVSQETKDNEIFEMVKAKGIPLLFMDRHHNISNVSTVTVDDRKGAYKTIDHAIKLGYRKIAHFAGCKNVNIGCERDLGFRQAMVDNGIEIKQEWILEGGYEEKSGYSSFMKLYNQKNLPDLIFAVTFPVALGVYMAARDVGIKIPEDVDLICFGNSDLSDLMVPSLSFVDQHPEQIATKSLQTLIDNIDNKEGFKVQHIVIDTDLVLRGTCTKYNRN